MKWCQKILILSLGMFPSIALAGAIDEAQPLAVSLTKVLDFLLLILGVLGILGMIMAGVLYFFAQGNPRQVITAKKALLAGITGLVLALGGMVLIWTIAGLLS